MQNSPVTPRLAASVMVFHAAPDGLRILYLRRNAELAFHGGYWVFPGGRVDPSDRLDGDGAGAITTARRAAVREASEEAGLEMSPDGLEVAVHWTTPLDSPIRFSTWFFVGAVASARVQIDGHEIHEYRWLRPADALNAQAAGTMRLAGPTFALTTRLAAYADVGAVMTAVREWPQERLLGCLHDVPGGCVAIYEQDVAYVSGGRDLDAVGARHRLWMVDGGWHYERNF